MPHHIQQMAGADHLGIGHQGGLFRAAGRQHQTHRHLLGPQRQAGGQGTAHGPQLPRQRQLTGKFMACQTARLDLPAGGQQPQCNGQVEAARVLGQIGGRQIDRDALVVGELQPRVLQGRAHTLARLLDLHIGQTDQGETGQAVGQMHFDGDRGGLQPHKCAALHQGKTHERFPPQMGAVCGLLPAGGWRCAPRGCEGTAPLPM